MTTCWRVADGRDKTIAGIAGAITVTMLWAILHFGFGVTDPKWLYAICYYLPLAVLCFMFSTDRESRYTYQVVFRFIAGSLVANVLHFVFELISRS